MSEIKKIRVSTGMTQKEFADYFHISLNTLQSWEREKDTRFPPEHVIFMIKYILYLESKINMRKKKKVQSRDMSAEL